MIELLLIPFFTNLKVTIIIRNTENGYECDDAGHGGAGPLVTSDGEPVKAPANAANASSPAMLFCRSGVSKNGFAPVTAHIKRGQSECLIWVVP